jgi:hypothetical protein
MDVAVWLRSLGLEKYEAAFRENEIDETVLPGLTAEDLQELGVDVLAHRRMQIVKLSHTVVVEGALLPSTESEGSCRGPWHPPPKSIRQ